LLISGFGVFTTNGSIIFPIINKEVTIMQRLLYGYKQTDNGEIIIAANEAVTVRLIFQCYLVGDSLRRIADTLYDKEIATPTGKERWIPAAINNLLLNSKYIPIVGFDQYAMAQAEIDRRSRNDLDTGKRKTARYSSSNVLGGLLVCTECGSSYRRVQRASGEIVWRCANRAEHGKEICKNSPTIAEADYFAFLRDTLGVDDIDSQYVKAELESIYIRVYGSLEAILKPKQSMILKFELLTMGAERGIIQKEVKMINNNIALPIDHAHTGKGRPNAIMHFGKPLSNRQQELLDSLPNYESRAIVAKSDVSMKDLSLTAKVGVEFAMFTRGSQRLIVRGNSRRVNINTDKAVQLAKDGYSWSGHTHPGFDRFILTESKGDRNILKSFTQEQSVIYNSLEQILTFGKE
jgi:hypothetical protein